MPVYRWADLWTRAMVASLRPAGTPAGRKVSGTLSVLGVDLRHHGYFVSFDDRNSNGSIPLAGSGKLTMLSISLSLTFHFEPLPD